ncbi:MAG: hypothetical protein HYY84_19975 [Deltaproteobacteria bacterium]|nr:hypothetical protein [Deltaproteobacteria bacterium]
MVSLLLSSSSSLAQVPIPGELSLSPRLGASVGIVGEKSLFAMGLDVETSKTGPLYLSFHSDIAFAKDAFRFLGGGGVKYKFVIKRKPIVPYVRGLMTIGFSVGKKGSNLEMIPRAGGGFRVHAYEKLAFGMETLFSFGGRVGAETGPSVVFDAVACAEFIF